MSLVRRIHFLFSMCQNKEFVFIFYHLSTFLLLNIAWFVMLQQCVRSLATFDCIGPLKAGMKIRRDMIALASEMLAKIFDKGEEDLVQQVRCKQSNVVWLQQKMPGKLGTHLKLRCSTYLKCKEGEPLHRLKAVLVQQVHCEQSNIVW